MLWPIAGVMAAVLVLGAIFMLPIVAPRALDFLPGATKYTVVFEVGGTAQEARVSVMEPGQPDPDENGPVQQLPWQRESTIATHASLHVRMIARATSRIGTVTCRITANGVLIAEKNEPSGYASCSGYLDTPIEPAPASPPPSGPPPHSDLVPELALPVGSTTHGGGDPNFESSESPASYESTVAQVRGQLPIGRDYGGMPWDSEHVEKYLTMWTWANATEVISVSVDGEVPAGAHVLISRKARR